MFRFIKMQLAVALTVALCTLVGMGPAVAQQVDINTASALELALFINGVGKKKAEAIVAHRLAHGPFQSVDQLTAVIGISAKLVEKNRSLLSVGAAAAESPSEEAAVAHSAP